MEQLDPNVFAIILSYIPDASTKVVVEVSSKIFEKVVMVEKDVLYWPYGLGALAPETTYRNIFR